MSTYTNNGDHRTSLICRPQSAALEVYLVVFYRAIATYICTSPKVTDMLKTIWSIFLDFNIYISVCINSADDLTKELCGPLWFLWESALLGHSLKCSDMATRNNTLLKIHVQILWINISFETYLVGFVKLRRFGVFTQVLFCEKAIAMAKCKRFYWNPRNEMIFYMIFFFKWEIIYYSCHILLKSLISMGSCKIDCLWHSHETISQ